MDEACKNLLSMYDVLRKKGCFSRPIPTHKNLRNKPICVNFPTYDVKYSFFRSMTFNVCMPDRSHWPSFAIDIFGNGLLSEFVKYLYSYFLFNIKLIINLFFLPCLPEPVSRVYKTHF